MKPSIKYAVISLLYTEPEGLWEDEIYGKLKPYYSKASLCSVREELTSFSTVGWISTTAVSETEGQLLRRFKLLDQHRKFIEYQMDPYKVLAKVSGGRLHHSHSISV